MQFGEGDPKLRPLEQGQIGRVEGVQEGHILHIVENTVQVIEKLLFDGAGRHHDDLLPRRSRPHERVGQNEGAGRVRIVGRQRDPGLA